MRSGELSMDGNRVNQAPRSRGSQRGGHAKRFFSSFRYGHEKIVVVGGVERMYHLRQFPPL